MYHVSCIISKAGTDRLKSLGHHVIQLSYTTRVTLFLKVISDLKNEIVFMTFSYYSGN